MQKIIPHLGFDGAAEEAAALYTGLVPGSRVGGVTRYGKAGFEQHGQPEGTVMTVELELGGYRMVGLNGGPHFHFTPAVSYFVTLEAEPEVDRFWDGLAEGGAVLMPLDAYPWAAKYGWLNDRYGVSWQVALGKRSDVGRQAVAPSLLFAGERAGRAEEAVTLYTSVFPNSRVEGILRYDGSGADAAGTVQHAQFQLGGETFMAMDCAGHDFGFTEANSQLVLCETQAEIDHCWRALSAVPDAEQCGWLKDRFGVSWQIVPAKLMAMMTDPDPAKVARVTEAFMAMTKLDIGALERARAA